MKEYRKKLVISIGLLAVFTFWTIVVSFVDVQQIGPQKSSVGLATINQFIHTLTGVHFTLYRLTDWLGCVPIGVCMGFGILGLTQWIQRRSFRKVDPSILVLGVFYIIILAAYLLFEHVIINYRPILINGHLEASYPSSTTLLVMCIMPTAILQWNHRIKNKILRKFVIFISISFIAFMIIGRLISGVHWFSDIIGGVLLSSGLVMLYDYLCHNYK